MNIQPFRTGLLAVTLILAPAHAATGPAPGSPEAERARWNEVFAVPRPNIRTEANEFLVRVAAELRPGAALDIGTGFGRNALHLARQGWTVTGIDVSDVGIEQLTRETAKEKLAVTALVQDAMTFDYGKNRWDLIALIYMGSLAQDLASRLTEALKPGGVIVIEHFWKAPNAPIGYESNVVRTWYPQLEVLHYSEDESRPDYNVQRQARVVRFLARKPLAAAPGGAEAKR